MDCYAGHKKEKGRNSSIRAKNVSFRNFGTKRKRGENRCGSATTLKNEKGATDCQRQTEKEVNFRNLLMQIENSEQIICSKNPKSVNGKNSNPVYIPNQLENQINSPKAKIKERNQATLSL
ncbi:MAG: hypothetical protein ACK5UE_07150 [Chitinophagales bacterium]|jgi:hypothetical protein